MRDLIRKVSSQCAVNDNISIKNLKK